MSFHVALFVVIMRIFICLILTNALTPQTGGTPSAPSYIFESASSETTSAPVDTSTQVMTIGDGNIASTGTTAEQSVSTTEPVTTTLPCPVTSQNPSDEAMSVPTGLKPFNESLEVKPSAVLYSDSLLDRIGATLALHIRAQLRGDEIKALGAPRLEYDAELIMTGPSAGILRIGKPLAITATATVFAVLNDTSRVVKYHHNCQELEDVHPLLRDYIFLQRLAGTDVSPSANYLSPPVRFPASVTPKTAFGMHPAARASCAGNEVAEVRFMVMERVPWTLDRLVRDLERIGRRLPLKHAIHMMASLVETVQRLHSRDIVHGDVHWGNVAVVNHGDAQTINLIDFGSAMFVDEMERLPVMARDPGSYTHCFFSHWNIEGYRFSYRDDVYKALLVGAFLINGAAYSHFCRNLEPSVDAMRWFKRNGFIFAMPSGPDRIAALDVDLNTKRLIRRRLSNALDLARSVEEIDERPDYDNIIAELMTVVGLLDASL